MPPVLREVKKNRVYEEIVAQVQGLIARGQLKAGDRLPPERDLVRAFRVSRASVREAICALESLGLVESRVGSGTYVTAASVEHLIQPLALAILQERDSLKEILETRRLIEPYLAGLAAERAEPSEVEGLSAVLDEHRRRVEGGETGAEADFEFHLAIAQAARNKVLLRIIHAIHDLLRLSRDASFQTGGRPKESLKGHLKIFEAIRKGDGAAARAAMEEHLSTIERLIKKASEASLKGSGRRAEVLG